MKTNKNWRGKSGIYCIINLKNQHKYVGSSMNIYTRINTHVSALRGNYHQNSYLQNAFNKYGDESFEVYILEFTDNLLVREQFYINTIKPEYNITIEVIRNTPSKESKAKHSITKKRMFEEKTLLPNCSKIIKQFSLKGELIQIYPNIIEASKVTGIHRTQIQRCLYKTYKQGGGYVWKYNDDYSLINEDFIRAKRNNNVVVVTNVETGEKLTFYSITQCANYFGVSDESIRYVVNKSQSGIYKGKFKTDLLKLGELLETPEVDNQQPSL